MAFVLEGKPFLFAGNDSLGAASFLLTGLALGGLLGWFLFEGPLIRTEPASIVWATAASLALHSFGDGLVLGRGCVGASIPVVRIACLTVSGTVGHRFVEGALRVVLGLAE